MDTPKEYVIAVVKLTAAINAVMDLLDTTDTPRTGANIMGTMAEMTLHIIEKD